jgi:diaminohydroxyphosphoribosylaminopyrimidine deaminase / 5-amino-6-(5-phosphoribosylamino)uracil reductase
VIVKAAVSSDGFVGRRDRRVKLTGARADQYFQQQRAEVDAVAVGSETVLVDDPLLTARGAWRERPLTRVIFDWRARVPETARVWSTLAAGPVIMVVEAATATDQAARGEAIDALVIVRREPVRAVRPVLEWLATRDIVSLLVEGGPALQAACRDEGVIDRVQYVLTPVELKEGVPAAAPTRAGLDGMHRPRLRVLGEDALVEFDVYRSD